MNNKFDTSMTNAAILDMHFKTATSVAISSSANTTKKNYSSKNNPMTQGNPIFNHNSVSASIGNNYANNVIFLKQ